MKARPLKLEDGAYHPCEPQDATHVELCLPGPMPSRLIPVILSGKREGTGCWSWNGDTEKPTLKPSIRTRWGKGFSQQCHTWINDGRVQFLADCTHEFAGQTLDLEAVEE